MVACANDLVERELAVAGIPKAADELRAHTMVSRLD